MVDSEGYMVTPEGRRLQGFKEFPGGLASFIDTDLRITRFPGAMGPEVTGFAFSPAGELTVEYANGSRSTTWRLFLMATPPGELLEPESRYEYRIPDSVLTGRVGQDGLGTIYQGGLSEQAGPRIPTRLRAGPPLSPDAPVGPLFRTGTQTDLALLSTGWFLVRDPVQNRFHVTRQGAFEESPEGLLVTHEGLRVQVGWAGVRGTADCVVRPAPSAAHGWSDWSVDRRGQVLLRFQDGWVQGAGRLVVLQAGSIEGWTALGGARMACPEGWTPTSATVWPDGVRVQQGALEMNGFTPELCARRARLKFIRQGAFFRTGVRTDLALAGQGFFLLRDPGSDRLFATRAGAFEFDAEGYLVTRRERFYPVVRDTPEGGEAQSWEPTLPGLRVLGYCDGSLERVGDVRLDPQVIAERAYQIDYLGTIRVGWHGVEDPGTVVGQVLTMQLDYPNGLEHAVTPEGWVTRIVYTDLERAQPRPFGAGGSGTRAICSGSLELVRSDESPLPYHDLDERRFQVQGMPEAALYVEASTDLRWWWRMAVCRTDPYGRAAFVVQDSEFSLADPGSQVRFLSNDPSETASFGAVLDLGPQVFYRCSRAAP